MQQQVANLRRSAPQDNTSLDDTWNNFKNVILTAARETCGEAKCGGNHVKCTKWWDTNIKLEVREKKKRWQNYLSNKSDKSYKLYKEQRIKVKKLVREAKSKSWEDFGHFLEVSHSENQKLFYRTINRLRREKDCPIKFIEDKNGAILRDESQIMERWKEYFAELLNESSSKNTIPFNIPEASETFNTPITMAEYEGAPAKVKIGKAAGHDEIAPEFLKYMGEEGKHMLFNVISSAWNQAEIPKDWEVSVITPIFKKGDNKKCENHRGISLLSVPGKLYSRILMERLKLEVEHLLEEEQCGFRANRGTQDLIFTMRQLSEKAIEYNRSIHTCFIDLEKAFDTVQWSEIAKVLIKRNVNGALIKRIFSFYKTCRNYIRTGNAKSDEFITCQGVRQGDILSPYLFIILMDDVIKETKSKIKAYPVGNWKMKPTKTSLLAYADDIVLLTDSAENLQYNLNIITAEMEKRGLTISIKKTETMIISKEHQSHNIFINNVPLTQVSQFKYLGSIISEDGKPDKDLNNRISATSKLYYSLNKNLIGKREVSTKTKLAVYNSMYIPTLTYGCESWTHTSSRKSRIQATEMKYLRRVAGKTRRDRIRNDTIRSNFNVTALNNRIDGNKLRWYGHIMRMEDSRIPKAVFQSRPLGSRSRGRQRVTWWDNVSEVLASNNIEPRSAKAIAQDRRLWRNLCYTSTLQGRRGPE